MFDTARLRLPVRGPILIYAGVALSLAACAHFAQRQLKQLSTATAIGGEVALTPAADAPDTLPAIDLGSTRSIEEQLAPYLPLVGLPLAGLSVAGLTGSGLGDLQHPSAEKLEPRGESTVDVPVASYLMTSAQLRERRGTKWTYPKFDTRGRHGAPLVPTARNIIVQLVDALGDPIIAMRLQVAQTGRDGSFTPSAYRSTEDPSVWTIGSPLLSPRGSADFELIARTESGAYTVIARLRRAPDSGDIDLGKVQLVRR